MNDDIKKALTKLSKQYKLEETEMIFLSWYCDLTKEERQKLFPIIEISMLEVMKEILNK